jgi:hypothetical protein
MSNIPDDIKSEPEEVNADQHLGDGADAADPSAAGNGSDNEPTQSGSESRKNQGDPLDDVDLEPPSA